jgi:hypothetical protein
VLQVGIQLAEALLVLAGVVTAEEQLSSGGKNGSDRGRGPAPVTTVGSG